MSTHTPRSQESIGTVTGPHDGTDKDGRVDHRYWRCRRCGLESTDPRLREGCFRCGSPASGERRGRDDERRVARDERDCRERRNSRAPDEVDRG